MATCKGLSIVLAAALSVGSAFAADKSDVMAAVHKFAEGANKGDAKAVSEACADQTSIIDEFAPHAWSGAGACAKWFDDFGAFMKKEQMSDAKLSLGKPRHVDVTGDAAYVVVPTTFTYKAKGKPEKEANAMWTLVLQKTGGNWRITSWAWPKP